MPRIELLLTDAAFAGSQIGLVAIGFAIVYRTTRHMHFAYAAIWTFVAYLYGSRIDAGSSVGVAFAAALAAAVVLSVFCLFCYRRVQGEFALVLASFGIYLAVLGMQAILWGPSQLGIVADATLAKIWLVDWSGTRLVVPVVYVGHLLALAAAAFLLFWALGRTRTGTHAMSVSDNRELALVTGVRVGRVEMAAYVASALCAAVSATVQVSAVGSDVFTGTELFIEALIVVIVAGPVVVKVVLAALLFGLVRSAAQMLLGTEWVTLATHLVLLLLIVLRPGGLFAKDLVWERKSSWLSSRALALGGASDARRSREGT